MKTTFFSHEFLLINTNIKSTKVDLNDLYEYSCLPVNS
jgi:hypothetical protein